MGFIKTTQDIRILQAEYKKGFLSGMHARFDFLLYVLVFNQLQFAKFFSRVIGE